MFIHASIFHLVGNLLFLLIFGLRAEEMFQPTRIPWYLFTGRLSGKLALSGFGSD